MKRAPGVTLFCAVILFCMPSAAQAIATNLTLTSAGHIVDNGVGSCTATLTGGSSVHFSCRNFNTRLHFGRTSTASPTTLRDPAFLSEAKLATIGTMDNFALQYHEVAAWLAERILANTHAAKLGNRQFALRAVSSPNERSAGFTKHEDADDHPGAKRGHKTLDLDDEPVTPVPEPSTVLLFGIGLLGLGVTLRRRRSQLT